MLHFPKGFRVPKAYRHPHFLLLPTTPSQAVVEFVAILRERDQLHQLFRPDDVWPLSLIHISSRGGRPMRLTSMPQPKATAIMTGSIARPSGVTRPTWALRQAGPSAGRDQTMSISTTESKMWFGRNGMRSMSATLLLSLIHI